MQQQKQEYLGHLCLQVQLVSQLLLLLIVKIWNLQRGMLFFGLKCTMSKQHSAGKLYLIACKFNAMKNIIIKSTRGSITTSTQKFTVSSMKKPCSIHGQLGSPIGNFRNSQLFFQTKLNQQKTVLKGYADIKRISFHWLIATLKPKLFDSNNMKSWTNFFSHLPSCQQEAIMKRNLCWLLTGMFERYL